MNECKKDVLAGLDIGSNKIVCLIGFTNSDGKLYIKGISHRESRGIKNGEIIDIKELTYSIIKAIDMAEKMAGVNVENIVVNVCNSHIASSLSSIDKVFSNKTITKNDLMKLASSLEEKVKENKKEILHLIPIKYVVDEHEVENPFEMKIDKFKVNFNSVVVDKVKLDNLRLCLDKTPLKIVKFVFDAYMSAISCATEDEMDDGCIVIDIGSSSTSFAVMEDGIFKYGASIKAGGDNITDDIAKYFNLKFDVAEKIKVVNVDLTLTKQEQNDLIKVDIDSDEEYFVAQNKKAVLNDFYKDTVERIICAILNAIGKKKLLQNKKDKTIILTGGTCSVAGLDVHISDLTNIKVRIGKPEFNLIKDEKVDSQKYSIPIYSTSIGMLLYLLRLNKNKKLDESQLLKKNKIKYKINQWFNTLIKVFIN